MALDIEWLGLAGGEWGQADPARGVAAGVLEIADLLDEGRLAGAQRARVQGMNMIEHPYEHLQPFGFRAVQLLDLEPQRGFLPVAGALHEFSEAFHFRGHALGSLAGGAGSFVGALLGVLPLAGGAGDLRCDGFQILNLGNNRGQSADLGKP